jgi:hypothetical protein
MIGAEDLHRLFEDLLKLKIDGTGGAMIVDIGVEIEAGIEKHSQGIEPSFVQDQSFLMEGGVMKESPPIDGSDGDPGHVGIAQDIIDIIESEDAPEELLE